MIGFDKSKMFDYLIMLRVPSLRFDCSHISRSEITTLRAAAPSSSTRLSHMPYSANAHLACRADAFTAEREAGQLKQALALWQQVRQGPCIATPGAMCQRQSWLARAVNSCITADEESREACSPAST